MPSDYEFIKVLLEGLSVGITALGGGLALWQFRRNQIWKETEFIAKVTHEFFDDRNVADALKMLDWEARPIELDQGRKVTVSRAKVRRALAYGKEADEFEIDEMLVRDMFDDCFTKLGQFEHHIRSNVITFTQIKPYLEYWCALLLGRRPKLLDEETVRQIWGFLEFYEYDPVVALLLRFGKRPPFAPRKAA